MATSEEPIVPLPCPEDEVPLATHVKASVLLSSRRLLDAQGLLEAYHDHLDPVHRTTLESAAAGEWLPVEVAVAHYGAADQLGIADQQAYLNGRASADRLQGTYLGVVVRTLGRGVPMWAALRRFPDLGDRLTKGGTHVVYRLGDQAARVEFHGMPYAHFRYVRHGLRGMVASAAEFVAKRVESQDASRPHDRTVARYLLTWS